MKKHFIVVEKFKGFSQYYTLEGAESVAHGLANDGEANEKVMMVYQLVSAFTFTRTVEIVKEVIK